MAGAGSWGLLRLRTALRIPPQDKHALLDVTPSAIERLNYVQYYPIVVFCAPESRAALKSLREWLAPASRRSSRRLYGQAQKLRKHHSHLFTGRLAWDIGGGGQHGPGLTDAPCLPAATVPLLGNSQSWFQELQAVIREQQARPIWTAEDQVPGLGARGVAGLRSAPGAAVTVHPWVRGACGRVASCGQARGWDGS